MPSSISVVIPAYNEAGAIEATLHRLKTVAQDHHWSLEVIVVDDGSSDETSAIAKKALVQVIRHPTNGGYGLSLQHGITAAKNEIVAITDADGTYPVEALPELVRMVEEDGFDMAVGARQGSEYRRGWWKYPARVLFRWLTEYISGRSIPDVNSGLRVFKKSSILPYLLHTCLGFSFTTSITAIFFLNGLFVGYHPITYGKRIGQSKVRHFRDTLRTAQILVSVMARFNPIKLFLLLAVLTGIVGVGGVGVGILAASSVIVGVGIGLVCIAPLIFCFGPLTLSLKNE